MLAARGCVVFFPDPRLTSFPQPSSECEELLTVDHDQLLFLRAKLLLEADADTMVDMEPAILLTQVWLFAYIQDVSCVNAYNGLGRTV